MRLVNCLTLVLSFSLFGCSAMPRVPLATAAHVELPRFMGKWYVLASIPTFLEKDSHNAVESYRLESDDTVATTFTFHKGSLDGPLKTFKPRGWVLDKSTNATWGMQFIWPIKAEYVIAYLNDDYTETVIARSSRDYVWIMARTPEVSVQSYDRLSDKVGKMGYDLSKLRRVPQQW